MAYYVRKISRSKWQENPLNADCKEAEQEVQHVAADAITNCTKTTGNKLSLWKVEELKKFHYNAVVNDYEGLGKFAKIVLISLKNHKRFKGKEVKEKLQKMLKNREIQKDMISDKLYEKIS